MISNNGSFEENQKKECFSETGVMCIQHVIHRAEIDYNSRECPPDILPLHQVGENHLAQGLTRRVWGLWERLGPCFTLVISRKELCRGVA